MHKLAAVDIESGPPQIRRDDATVILITATIEIVLHAAIFGAPLLVLL